MQIYAPRCEKLVFHKKIQLITIFIVIRISLNSSEDKSRVKKKKITSTDAMNNSS